MYRFLFSIVFHGKSFSRTLLSALHPECGGKDAVYRFLNSPRHHWRRFLWLLSSAVVLKALRPLIGEDWRSVLIVDDSVFSRSRSKAVELLSRVHDHTTNTYVRGFRMLALGWSDGNSLIPLAFSLLSSAKETNRSKQWLALISTDLSLSDEEVVQMYEKRWDIEVFFKTVKSYLKLTRECYSRSYDALVAQATVVFSRYILLAIEQRMIEQ